MKVIDQSYELVEAIACLREEHYGEGHGLAGHITTADGIVQANAWTWSGIGLPDDYSDLEIVVGGRRFTRAFDGKAYTKRGLVTKAKKFAREMREKEQKHEGNPMR